MITTGAKLVSESQQRPSPHTDAQVGLKRPSFISIIRNKLRRRSTATTTSQRDGVNAPSVMPPTSSALLALIQDPIGLRNALSHLQDWSLVAIQHNSQLSTLRIHDLVQLVVLETMKGSRAYRESFELAVHLACSALGQIQEHWLPQWWRRCEPLIPHIQMLTQQQETSAQAKRQLLLANRYCGWYLSGRGRYVEAEQLCRTILSESERSFGPEDLHTVYMVDDLAWVHLFQGRYSDIEPLLNRVLRTRKERLGSEHRDTLTSMYRLAVVYYHQRRYDDAEELLNQTLRIQERQFGSQDVHILYTSYMLARVYLSQHRSSDAELMFKRVLAVQVKILDPDHTDTLATMHELALVYDAQQRYDDAEELFTQVLLGKEKIYGSGHPETLITKYCMARVYFSRSQYLEATAILVPVLARREEILGESHPFTQDTICLLACVYENLGQSDDAAALRQRLVPPST